MSRLFARWVKQEKNWETQHSSEKHWITEATSHQLKIASARNMSRETPQSSANIYLPQSNQSYKQEVTQSNRNRLTESPSSSHTASHINNLYQRLEVPHSSIAFCKAYNLALRKHYSQLHHTSYYCLTSLRSSVAAYNTQCNADKEYVHLQLLYKTDNISETRP